MKQHATNLLKYMPVDDIASGKGPGKHGVHKSMAKYGEPKGQGPGKHHPGMPEYGKPTGPGEYGSMGPKLEMPDMNVKNKKKPEDKKDNKSHRDYEGGPSKPFNFSKFFGFKVKGRA